MFLFRPECCVEQHFDRNSFLGLSAASVIVPVSAHFLNVHSENNCPDLIL